jgi:hypothetical protein
MWCIVDHRDYFEESDLLVDESDEDEAVDVEVVVDSLETDEESPLLSFLLDSDEVSLLVLDVSLVSDADERREAPFEDDRLSVT